MPEIPVSDLLNVYGQLKDRYPLTLTNSFSLNDGFTADLPIIVAKAHGPILWLYEDDSDFVLDVMDAAKTKGTHWHPCDIAAAVTDIREFMEGKSKYRLKKFPHPIGGE